MIFRLIAAVSLNIQVRNRRGHTSFDNQNRILHSKAVLCSRQGDNAAALGYDPADPLGYDPVTRKLAEDFAAAGIVDFVGRSQTGSPDYKPVVRQLRRWIEARHRAPIASIPFQAQLAYLEVFRGTAELYAYLLNDRSSFVARSGHALLVAGEPMEVGTNPGSRIALLRVLRAWQGVQADTVLTVVTSTQGVRFMAGDSYLVYAADSMLARDRDRWLAGSRNRALRVGCSRTRPLRTAAEDLKTLGLGTSDAGWLRGACRTAEDSLALLPIADDLARRGRSGSREAK